MTEVDYDQTVVLNQSMEAYSINCHVVSIEGGLTIIKLSC
jgi:hypothetical protein